MFIHIRMHALYVFIGGRVFYVIVNINMHGGVKMPIFFFNILEINLVENMYGAILSIVDINKLNMKWGMIMCFVYKNFRRHRLFYRFLSFFKIKYTIIVSKLITSRNSPNLFFFRYGVKRNKWKSYTSDKNLIILQEIIFHESIKNLLNCIN